MQAKISAFFKPSTPKDHESLLFLDNIDAPLLPNAQEIQVTYTRRILKSNLSEGGDASEFGAQQKEDLQLVGSHPKPDDQEFCSLDSVNATTKSASTAKILKKKRSYAQYHLELGQADFLLHTCSICGLKYACGDEEDERVHKEFHKNFSEGIQFKGWRNERVVSWNSSDADRIILVMDGDLPAHRHKVEEVVKMMEKELGSTDGWLLHELCKVNGPFMVGLPHEQCTSCMCPEGKVYLFISRQRIVGCLVVEPIRSAHRVIMNKENRESSDVTNCKKIKSSPIVLQFGLVNFQREVVRKPPPLKTDETVTNDYGTILYEKEAIPATCGVRAIWVAPASRRKHIATMLLDAMRKSFCKGYVLESSQCAFSQPTSSGKALASGYCHTGSFLIYMMGTHRFQKHPATHCQ